MGPPEHCVLSGAVSQSADHSAPDARAWEAGCGVCHAALPALWAPGGLECEDPAGPALPLAGAGTLSMARSQGGQWSRSNCPWRLQAADARADSGFAGLGLTVVLGDPHHMLLVGAMRGAVCLASGARHWAQTGPAVALVPMCSRCHRLHCPLAQGGLCFFLSP